jgi:diamine N-acetyltransferase
MYKIRSAKSADLDQILDLVMQLAIQEGLPNEVKITKIQLETAIFCENPSVFIDIVEHPEKLNKIAAFALYWIDFPTWLGRHGIYIEDICVTRELRGQGIGNALMSHLAQTCIKRNYSRLAWWVKDDNSEANQFYRGMGASIKDDFTVRHLTGPALNQLANNVVVKTFP